jgi:hypothetical protein
MTETPLRLSAHMLSMPAQVSTATTPLLTVINITLAPIGGLVNWNVVKIPQCSQVDPFRR